MCVPVSFDCCASLCTEYAITSVCVSTAEETASLRGLSGTPLHPLPTGCSLTALCQGQWPQKALVRGRHLPGLLGIFSMHQVWHEGETGRSVGVTLQTWSLSVPPPLPTQVWCFHLSKYHNFCCTVNNVSIVLLALLCFLNLACFLLDPSMNKCSRNSFLTSSLFRCQRSLILWYCLAGLCKLFNVNGWRLIKIEAKEVWNHWIHIYAKICIL